MTLIFLINKEARGTQFHLLIVKAIHTLLKIKSEETIAQKLFSKDGHARKWN